MKLFAGLLLHETELLEEVKRELEALLGEIDRETPLLPFLSTSYYDRELGTPIQRKFYSFTVLRSPEGLYRMKVQTNELEKRFSRDGRRRVNIDPGYLEFPKVLLFTTKNFSHRIYLGEGIFAEVTLSYKGKEYLFFPWTYPDYKSPEYLDFFYKMRADYKKQLGSAG